MTQCERILKYMDDFGCTMGIEIESETRTAKNRYGESTHYSVYRRV